MKNVLGKQKDRLDVPEDFLLFLLPLPVLSVVPPRVLGRLLHALRTAGVVG